MQSSGIGIGIWMEKMVSEHHLEFDIFRYMLIYANMFFLFNLGCVCVCIYCAVCHFIQESEL